MTTVPQQTMPTTGTLVKLRMSQLVAMNFQIDPAKLEPHIPPGLELDFYRENETYVSLVAAKLGAIRVWGIPVHVATGFGQLQLRFYVRRKTPDGYRAGICSVRTYVSSRAGGWILSRIFKGGFDHIKMKYNNTGFGSGSEPTADYQWTVPPETSNRIRIQGRDRIKRINDDSKVGFILNHFTIYGQRGDQTLEYPVHHPSWNIWSAGKANFTCDVKNLFGAEFVKALSRRPASVFITAGSDVTVYRPTVVS
ncbi:MAG: DUF2071 domain-containing protein [Planctomycetota bacterium]